MGRAGADESLEHRGHALEQPGLVAREGLRPERARHSLSQARYILQDVSSLVQKPGLILRFHALRYVAPEKK